MDNIEPSQICYHICLIWKVQRIDGENDNFNNLSTNAQHPKFTFYILNQFYLKCFFHLQLPFFILIQSQITLITSLNDTVTKINKT